jgi:type IV pilus assembly protein PilY1
MGCYSYAAGDGYFKRSATATKPDGGAIACVNQWSGNLLNWAVSSSLDGVRLALTGGDRVIDEPDRTVLQRAVLPEDFYRSADFPDKTVTGNLDKLTPLVTTGRDGVLATGTLHFGNCLDRFAVGPAGGGTCTEPGGTTYLARVEVCTPTEAAARPRCALRTPDGNYKPVGSIQRYAGRMKFSVFGYLPDDDPARYGGVLRAPMKHAGPKKIDATFDTVDNPRAEWDATTGVFKAGAAEGDGVVDAINRFGRNGAGQGAYSLFDPAGELYYESLRYLQGKAPTPNAVSGTDSARSHGDPIAASCQRNGILVIGDAETHYDRSLPACRRATPSATSTAVSTAQPMSPTRPTGQVWSVPSKTGRHFLFTHPSGKAGLTTSGNEGPRALQLQRRNTADLRQYRRAETGADKGSFGMAGLAYWAHTQKIRSDHPEAAGADLRHRHGAGRRERHRAEAARQRFLPGREVRRLCRQQRRRQSISGASGGGSEWAEGLDADNQPKPANYFLASDAGADDRRPSAGSSCAPCAIGWRHGGQRACRRTRSRTPVRASTCRSSTGDAGRARCCRIRSAPMRRAALCSAATTRLGCRRPADRQPERKPPVAARDIASRRIFTLSTAGVGVPFEWAALDDGLARLAERDAVCVPAASDALGAERLAYLRGRSAQGTVGAAGRVPRARFGHGRCDQFESGLLRRPRDPGTGYDKFLAAHRRPAARCVCRRQRRHAARLRGLAPARSSSPMCRASCSPGWLPTPRSTTCTRAMSMERQLSAKRAWRMARGRPCWFPAPAAAPPASSRST